jgi:tetratricopeptide (TPR) repeat protein
VSENVDTQSQQAVVGYLGALAYSRPDQALDAAQKIQSPSSQAAALSTIAQAQAIAGQFADALHTAQKIQEPPTPAARGLLVSTYPLHTAQEIQDPPIQAVALGSIAQAQAIAGQFADALHTAQKIQEPRTQAAALSTIAQAQAIAGQSTEAAKNWEAALRTAPKIQDPTSVLVPIAQAQVTAGQFAEAAKNWEAALRTAQGVQLPYQAGMLNSIAQAQAIAGQFADALHTARHIQNETNRSSALTAIATGQAKAHHWKAARNTVAPCLGRDRLEAYTIILTEYAKANNPKLEQQLKRTKPTTDR